MKTNTYFENLDRIARDFEQKHEAVRETRRQREQELEDDADDIIRIRHSYVIHLWKEE